MFFFSDIHWILILTDSTDIENIEIESKVFWPVSISISKLKSSIDPTLLWLAWYTLVYYCQITLIRIFVWCAKQISSINLKCFFIINYRYITGSLRSADLDPCPTLTLWRKKVNDGNFTPEIQSYGGQMISIDENSMTAELINRRRSKVSSILNTGGTSPTTSSPTPIHRLRVRD